jgi:hypothetical protein
MTSSFYLVIAESCGTLRCVWAGTQCLLCGCEFALAWQQRRAPACLLPLCATLCLALYQVETLFCCNNSYFCVATPLELIVWHCTCYTRRQWHTLDDGPLAGQQVRPTARNNSLTVEHLPPVHIIITRKPAARWLLQPSWCAACCCFAVLQGRGGGASAARGLLAIVG